MFETTLIPHVNSAAPSRTAEYDPQPVISGQLGGLVICGRFSPVISERSCLNPEGNGRMVEIGIGS